jgi:hypothetical protein
MTGYHVAHVPDDGLLAEDDEGWGFVTGMNFGCVNYQLKELPAGDDREVSIGLLDHN